MFFHHPKPQICVTGRCQLPECQVKEVAPYEIKLKFSIWQVNWCQVSNKYNLSLLHLMSTGVINPHPFYRESVLLWWWQMFWLRMVPGMGGMSPLSYQKACALRQQLRCAPFVTSIPHFHHSTCHPWWLANKFNFHRISCKYAKDQMPVQSIETFSFSPSFHSVQKIYTSPERLKSLSSSSTLVVNSNKKNYPSNMPIMSLRKITFTSGRLVHTEPPHRDVPAYLQGNVSEINIDEEDLFDDDLVEELYKDMEDDILEYLIPRLISYEETDTSFVIPCPHCSKSEPDTSNQEIFIDKNSG